MRAVVVRWSRWTLAAPLLLAGCGDRADNETSVAAALEPMRYETTQEAPVNSWWLPTPDGGVIVFDALRTISDARAAVDVLRKTNRPVHAIPIDL